MKLYSVDNSKPLSFNDICQPENLKSLSPKDFHNISNLEVGQSINLGFGSVEVKRVQ